MLHYKHPSVEKLGRYLESFSEKKRAPSYSVGRGMRQVRSSAELRLGPGEYKSDRDFVMDDKTETDAKAYAPSVPAWTLGLEKRENSDGVLKGIAASVPGNSGLSPGQYSLPEKPCTKPKGEPSYSFTKAIESQEALRARKAGTDVPGPGTYRTYSSIEVDEETKKATEKLAKKIETTWAASQYSHMFAVMRPKAPNKKGGEGSAVKPFK